MWSLVSSSGRELAQNWIGCWPTTAANGIAATAEDAQARPVPEISGGS